MRLSQGYKYLLGVSLAALLFVIPIAPCLAQTPSFAATRKAAEQGDAKAEYNLGIIYGRGQGVPPDQSESTKWIRKSAQKGYAAAQFDIGLWYFKGDGVPQEYKEAAKWGISMRNSSLGICITSAKAFH
jgi:Sel1 repeat